MLASWLSLNLSLAKQLIIKMQRYMEQLLLSITLLEAIGIGFVAVGVFLFYRACWQNIKRSKQRKY
jgi:hypothetical protein